MAAANPASYNRQQILYAAPYFPAKREKTWHVSFIRRAFAQRVHLRSCAVLSLPVRYRGRLRTSTYLPGQFVSAVAPDENGKQQTRAYSIASAPAATIRAVREPRRERLLLESPRRPARSARWLDHPDPRPARPLRAAGADHRFDLCRHRHRRRAHARLHAVALSRAAGPDRSQGKEIWLVYGTRYETDMYYHDEFVALAERVPNFHYLPTLSRAQPSGPACAVTCRITSRRSSKNAPRGWATAACAARRSRDSGRRAALRHLHLHLRAELHGVERARAAWPASAGTRSRSSSSATTERRRPIPFQDASGAEKLHGNSRTAVECRSGQERWRLNDWPEPAITVEAGKMGGKPCIRGLRFTVYDLASYLASGMTEDGILRDFPYLEKEDFQAVYEFFASIRKGLPFLKLLVDENLPLRLVHDLRRLVSRLDSCQFRGVGQHPRCNHLGVRKTHGFALLTKDKDFANLGLACGAPPQVILLQTGNC